MSSSERRKKSDIVTNAMSQTVAYVTNAIKSRAEFISGLLDTARRNIDRECGYPEGAISIEQYKRAYDRNGYGYRVVSLYPEESWKTRPLIYEQEDEEETAFEAAWKQLERERSCLTYLKRVDEISGIGEFGILLIGLDDGLGLELPAAGLDPFTGEDKGKPKDGDEPAEPPAAPPPAPEEPKRKLIYLRAFDQSVVDVETFETDPRSPRFGQPTMYKVRFIDPNKATSIAAAVQGAGDEKRVHWTRVLHVADNRKNSDVFGVPRMQVVYNNVLNLRKISGGSAEGQWKGGFPGLSVEAHPARGDMPALQVSEADLELVKGQILRYMEGMQRYLTLIGSTAKTLEPNVNDPTPHKDIQVEEICVALACPQRVFMGSERGELASSQDAKAWNDRVRGRQDDYLIPCVVRPFVERLIALGVLPRPVKTRPTAREKSPRRSSALGPQRPAARRPAPEPTMNAEPVTDDDIESDGDAEPTGGSDGEVIVYWPDVDTASDIEKADIGLKRVQTLATYVEKGVDQVVPPHKLLTVITDMCDDEEADAILQEADEYVGEGDTLSDREHAKKVEEMQVQGEQRLAEIAAKPSPKPPGAGGPPRR